MNLKDLKKYMFLIFILSVILNSVLSSSGEESSNDDLVLHNDDDKKEIAAILADKYKFKNTERLTRYKVLEKNNDTDVSDDMSSAWFRSIAMRRIVGGMDTSISMYPYNVAISRNGKHWCGGSIIDEQWVFTAAHCFESAHDGDKRKLQPFIIRAGSSFHNHGGYQARVNKAFFPEKYSPGGADYDYCLLRLDRPMPVGRNIAVLNLPSKDYEISEEDMILVTGWGSTDNSGIGRIPERLRFVPVPIMKQEECQKSYRFYITPRMLCAGYAGGEKDACNHDSGGPAVRDGVLLGIVSFGGKKCGDPRFPGVYARVSFITDWVEKTVTTNEASNVPELIPKIMKARKRVQELKKFKARVEDKKNKIKKWLRSTLKSPTFIELARNKLKESGILRRAEIVSDVTDDDETMMDEVNLNNMITEKIIEGEGESPELDKLLRTLVIRDLMLGNEGNFTIISSVEQKENEDLFPKKLQL